MRKNKECAKNYKAEKKSESVERRGNYNGAYYVINSNLQDRVHFI